jgi:peptide/nickel transport system substrate-binding protein
VSGKAATTTYQNSPPIIGDGPFQVVEWQKGKFVRLVANKDYWGGAPKVDQVVFQLYTNPDTMASDLKLGTLDGAIDVPMAQFKQLGSQPGITTSEGTSWRFTELAMNCSTSKYSKGNPVLRDVRVRQAINWAIDRAKVVSIAEQNYATVGSSLIVPYSKFHWEPPADQAYAYDPNKANAMLDAAGYKDINGDGYRETPQGKKIDLRFYATTDAPDNQTAGKLIVSWLKNIGIKVTYTVIDSGALTDAQYNFVGNNYAPDWDMFIWYWTQDVDPQFMLSIYTPAQSTGYGWNDCLWTSPAYTKLNTQQSQTIDDATRIPIAQQMQKLFYEGAGYAILTYPYQLEAYNTAKWQGWVHVPGDSTTAQKGAVLYSYNNIDTYRFVGAKTTTTAASSSNSTALIVVIVAAAVVVLGAVLLLRRNRNRSETA